MKILIYSITLFFLIPFKIICEDIEIDFINYFMLKDRSEIIKIRKSFNNYSLENRENILDTVLIIRLYQLDPELSFLREAEDRLKQVKNNSRNDMHAVLSGVVNGYFAREKKIFGMRNLKKMRNDFNNISEDPHWLVRFLRGITLFQVCDALPELFILKKYIAEGKETAEKDFNILEKTENIPGKFRNAYKVILEKL